MHHELKIDRPYFQAIKDGKKTFEVRFNDRGFQAGDTVLLREYISSYTNRQIRARIGYVTNFAQKENWVVFSLIDVEVEA